MRGPFEEYRCCGPFLKVLGDLRKRGSSDADCLWRLVQRIFRGEVELIHSDYTGAPHRYIVSECHHDVRVRASGRRLVVFVSIVSDGGGAADPVEDLY